ncbi:restriction endonuclease [Candidatus Symbiopectobacterium sp. NZEC127]|uniref:SNF2-related protein n=1 Tax=Candidatus Symbiopectobacterium sp. NZEC127 TaxID=2820472 RepID=UPI002225F21D|nr:SNF2-related protein [Candidatus Symbiopectobacterium sp. NZEC127]MCW2486532.1 restriction endonuclease [Candidatus Symbiopectobacterium sp. NZEC127]
MVFKFFKKANSASTTWRRTLSAKGILVHQAQGGFPLESALLAGYLAQLIDDGLATEAGQNVEIPWDSAFTALQSSDYFDLTDVFALPSFTTKRPILQSRNALTDENFSIFMAGWQDECGRTYDIKADGPLLSNSGNHELVRPEHWRLIKEVIAFSRRPQEARHDTGHRQAWGKIRTLALEASARLDDFLRRSVVLTPERLNIGLRKSVIAEDDVIEIAPSFEGAPEDWLERFDARRTVHDRYDIPTPEGIVQVLITPQVKTVLQEVKRLPLRRVSGSRAQAFVLNPYAALGQDAKDVIDEAQFEHAREQAGLQYERFTPHIERDVTGYPNKVGLLIESASAVDPVASANIELNDEELADFAGRLETALARNFQLLGWRGYDLELLGEAPDHLVELQEALQQRRQDRSLVTYSQVHDLSAYSSRIEGIGFEKPYYSPYIAKKNDDEGWVPDNVQVVIISDSEGEQGAVEGLPATKAVLDKLRKAVSRVQSEGNPSVKLDGLSKDIPLDQAKDILDVIEGALDDVQQGKNPTERPMNTGPKAPPRKTLILRPNIQSVDYEEKRREALLALHSDPELPHSLNPCYPLLPHQQQGLAWLQHLYKSRAEYEVRGAVLADDMGLGKTLQLLSLMAWLVEHNPNVLPMLVVAPVSLLENWAEEVGKFIQPGILPILMAYGNSLASLRVPREDIEERLQAEDGLVRFLKPGWIGSAKVVLTTYETLRDLEFSFASERWSLMVCDEAQRIKNPAAMVTRAAKKQNVDFKIACTGTPVENTLADLWCLFDFVQPGLLGALNDFGDRYRKPIEAKDEEERARVEELRTRISPQILRRTKAEVAKDLPKKILVEECRRLQLSSEQRKLYASAIESFKTRKNPDSVSPFKNTLGLLHYLRLICTDPRRYGLMAPNPEPLVQYRKKSPKMNWLLGQLETIRDKGEKAIIFCEFRNIQRLLKYYIEEKFKVSPPIINGDTSAAAGNADSRQRQIRKFQDAPGFGVIILSPVAVGFGVNIQAANHVVHYTRTWNPAKEDQATDRAYRIGQKKDVYVYYPVVRADDFSTFDVKLDQLLTRKRELAGDMLNGSGDIRPGDFNIDDVVPPSDRDALNERITLRHALSMEPRHFEGLVAILWGKQGYQCYCTPQSRDQGIDVVATRSKEGVLIQAKTSSLDGKKLGWDAVKEVVAGAAFYQQKHQNVVFRKVCITNQFFNGQAHEQAVFNDVLLIDQTGLADLLQRHLATMLELDQILYTEWGAIPEAVGNTVRRH